MIERRNLLFKLVFYLHYTFLSTQQSIPKMVTLKKNLSFEHFLSILMRLFLWLLIDNVLDNQINKFKEDKIQINS